MNDSRELHQRAMDLAHKAFLLKMQNKTEESIVLFEDAFNLEREAAFIEQDNYSAITRYVLFRSSASIAINANKLRDAEEMIAYGLIGSPPNDIADELRDLQEQINFNRHLELRGISLSTGEMQLSLSGPEVGFGIIKADEFIKRYEVIKKMSYRIYERKRGMPFRERGAFPKEVRNHAETFLSLPRASSFAITIKFGDKNEEDLFDTISSDFIINDLIENINLVQDDDYATLSKKIEDKSYFYNTIALVKELAPDIKNINFVGIKSTVKGDEKTAKLIREKKNIKLPILHEISEIDEVEEVSISGKITGAELHDESIKIIENDGNEIKINVPQGIMADIVRPYWERNVTILCKKIGDVYNYLDIEEVE